MFRPNKSSGFLLVAIGAVSLCALLATTLQSPAVADDPPTETIPAPGDPTPPPATPTPTGDQTHAGAVGNSGSTSSATPTVTIKRYKSPVTEGTNVYFKLNMSSAPASKLNINLR